MVCDARNHAHPLPRSGRRSGNTPICQLFIGSKNKLRVQVDERQVKEQTLERLQAVQPLLSEIMDVKLVVQPRKNMINIRVKPEYVTRLPSLCFCNSLTRYVTLVWHAEIDGVRYCFFMSDKLEPYIIITG